jgi:hypothetical chaperone protein
MTSTKKKYFGIDFGTSNSTVGVFDGYNNSLIPLESNEVIMPSAMFYNSDDGTATFGQAAISEYLNGSEGRLIRSFKSMLGTSLFDETTRLGEIDLSCETIISTFIGRLKAKAQEYAQDNIDSIVLGRPIHFVDDNEKADLQAQQQLESIARDQGFKNIIFQYEPVAAVLNYEQNIVQEEIALVIDIGGGTSDFSIIRLNPVKKDSQDRTSDILANDGIHIGGTDFDRLFSFDHVMPYFGRRSLLKPKNLMLPNYIFNDLATWHRINLLYNYKTEKLVDSIYLDSLSPEKTFRLVDIIKLQKGHDLAIGVEKAKIALTNTNETILDLSFIKTNDHLTLTLDQLNFSISNSIENIDLKIKDTIKKAAINKENITTIFLTGGSTALPLIRTMINNLLPTAKIITGDLFGSVGLGLAIEARRKFS